MQPKKLGGEKNGERQVYTYISVEHLTLCMQKCGQEGNRTEISCGQIIKYSEINPT